MDTLCDVSESVSDHPDLVGGEGWFLLPGDGGQCVKLLLCRFPVTLRVVDPLGDDGGVGSGAEGGLVAGEASLAFLDRLAGLSLLGSLGLCCARCDAGLVECGDGGGEPVRVEGPGDPCVQCPADDVFAQVDGARVVESGVEGCFLFLVLASVVDAVADRRGLHLPSAQSAPHPSSQDVGPPTASPVGAFLPLVGAGALSAGPLGGFEEFLGDEWVVCRFVAPDPFVAGVVGHGGAMAECDVVDVEEAFFLALFVPDLVAGVAGAVEDRPDRTGLPCLLRPVGVAGGVVGGRAGDAVVVESEGDGLVAHAVDVHGEDAQDDECGGGVGFEFVELLSGGCLGGVGVHAGVGDPVAVGRSPSEVAALELGL
ncbi:hypothetical protein P3H78_08885 [Streptomyces sp. K1PA1]|uniref:Uncharacterized protein n=1 Tax=Streptomyces tropicalis TaxID=3034234 RepID=A0ABT6A284_9ACTN|nr:hypothetical protein [Streptomyces tropicalis]MDF3298744.1 hypothetical protein [Streptomyces tropicalis]